MKNVSSGPWALVFMGLTLTMGCNGLAEDPTSCSQDFDCSAGEVCSAEGICTTAGQGDSRTFGEISLEVSSTDEQFLVTVYSLPMNSSAPSGDPIISFTLNGAGNAIAKKVTASMESRSRTQRSSQSSQEWQNRLAFDAQRHEGIKQLIDDAYSGRRSIRPLAYKNSGCGGCDSLTMCWKGECVTEVTASLPGSQSYSGTLVEVVDGNSVSLNVVVENSLSSNSAAIDAAKSAAELVEASLSEELSYFGKSAHDGDLDRDGDGRLNLFFTKNQLSAGVAGFFNFSDFLPAGDAAATGNESDILWVVAPGVGDATTAGAIGTLVHEYTHLASYGIRVYGNASAPLREELWLDESLAHTMEDLMGWGVTNIRAVEQALGEWDSTGFASTRDSVAMRGMGYTLIRFLLDRKGAGAGASSASDSPLVAKAKEEVKRLIAGEALGFEHSLFQNEKALQHGKWLLALYAGGNEDVLDEAKKEGYLSVGTASTGNSQGFNPWGTFEDSTGAELELEGLSPDELDELPADEEGELYVGGSVLYLISGLEPGSHTIKAVGDAMVGGEAIDLYLSVTRVQ